MVINAPNHTKYNKYTLTEDTFAIFASQELAKVPLSQLLISPGLSGLALGKKGHSNYYSRFLKKMPKPHKLNMNCDSIDTIKNLTLASTYLGILPCRVTKESDSKLVQVWPENNRRVEESRHTIDLVMRKSISPNISHLFIDNLKLIFSI